MQALNRLFGISILVGIAVSSVSANFPAPAGSGCGDVTEQQFRYVKLFGNTSDSDPFLLEPVHMALVKQQDDSVGIYFVERWGKVKYYDGATHKVALLATFDPFVDSKGDGGQDAGLSGIAADPHFNVNHWLYIFYTPKSAPVFRVSRFTVSGEKLLMESEKVILSIPMQRQYCCHTGGAMAFDAKGDLWIDVGNNSQDMPKIVNENNRNGSAEASSGNTADMRGGVLRIHPDDSPKGYTIPPGNFGDYWSKKFAVDDPALSRQYADTAKVLPEIYVKGTRSNYSIAVDPYRERLAWGEFLPPGIDEHNYVNHPVFAGYPYWGGPGNVEFLPDRHLDITKPVNSSKWYKGPDRLPPAETALHPYNKSSGGITGPIYRYDGDLKSNIKFPPHFDKAWFVTDFNWRGLKILGVNEAGDQLTDTSLTWFNSFNFRNALDIQQGPDGALYVLNYAGRFSSSAGTSFGRIEYTGPCHPAEPKLPTVAVHPGKNGSSNPDLFRVDAVSGRMEVVWPGGYRLSIKDVDGKEVFTVAAQGSRVFTMDTMLGGRRGVFFATLQTETRSLNTRFFRL